jgi:hypothetical protein
MLEPTINEMSALSAHRREVALVRWSLVAVPDLPGAGSSVKRLDPLHSMDRGYPRTVPFPTAW